MAFAGNVSERFSLLFFVFLNLVIQSLYKTVAIDNAASVLESEVLISEIK